MEVIIMLNCIAVLWFCVRDSVMWEVMRILSTTQDNDIPNRTHNTLAYTIILTHVHTSLNGLLPTRES